MPKWPNLFGRLKFWIICDTQEKVGTPFTIVLRCGYGGVLFETASLHKENDLTRMALKQPRRILEQHLRVADDALRGKQESNEDAQVGVEHFSHTSNVGTEL